MPRNESFAVNHEEKNVDFSSRWIGWKFFPPYNERGGQTTRQHEDKTQGNAIFWFFVQ